MIELPRYAIKKLKDNYTIVDDCGDPIPDPNIFYLIDHKLGIRVELEGKATGWGTEAECERALLKLLAKGNKR